MRLRRAALARPTRRLACAVLAGCALAAGAAPKESVELVFGAPDAPRALRLSASGAEPMATPGSTPLGSLWKLFVYAYLTDSPRKESDYRCTGGNPGEESFCCSPGESIGREEALAKSCGLYFAPRRLGLSAVDWRQYWMRQSSSPPAWLLDLDQIQAGTEVPVASLLSALAAVGDNARQRTMATLLRVTIEPRARPLLASVGTTLRVKTWTWHDAQKRKIGGFGGWLADGTPIWLRGSGGSAQVIERSAPWLAEALPIPAAPENACVRVRFFKRYPLAEVLQNGRPVPAGPLRGQVEARFANGNRLSFAANGDLRLERGNGRLAIEGRFGVNDYVARVVQREAAAQPREAARALAVAARTYLVRHADLGGGCYEIDDDSRTQRVSAAPPEKAALAVAYWSDALVLSDLPGHYHATRSAPGLLSWRTAVAQADDGLRWDEILGRAYGNPAFGFVGEADAGECQPLPQADAWLAGKQAQWRRRLAGTPGFEVPTPLPHICRLSHGKPYADIDRGRIYAYGIGSSNDRLAVAHEYLHFALANHPRGRDEDFVERTAHTLLGTL